jgi:hypothetical protein
MTDGLLAELVAPPLAGAEADRLAVLGRTQLLDWPPAEFDCRTTALHEDTGAAVVALIRLGSAITLILMSGAIVGETVGGCIREGAADSLRSTTSAVLALP